MIEFKRNDCDVSVTLGDHPEVKVIDQWSSDITESISDELYYEYIAEAESIIDGLKD